MSSLRRVAVSIALALAVSLVAARYNYSALDCVVPLMRAGPGRDVSFSNWLCPSQVASCSAICGKNTQVNQCDNDGPGVDNPFQYITYCFKCICADGSVPELWNYRNTVPNEVCQRWLQNCQYSWGGPPRNTDQCTPCGDQDAADITWTTTTASYGSTITATVTGDPSTRTAVETITEIVTPSWSLTIPVTALSDTSTTSTSFSAPYRPTSSKLESTLETTAQSTAQSATTPVSSSTSRSTSTTASPAPTSTASAGAVRPAIGVLGIAFAAAVIL
ncbi:hypothetical protein B0T17DRAFT_511119 [Bombardia bombarda]|uniref:DUF7707 domain-containing protein n=1 Tax=Bombardia bombarda TaxID=252184 RepID=A0AA40BVP4_9PEZI|nr:hypothetical protein B0T17DRAFT_511119 [Bombardia bombarda]